jgi:uncharacterized damage-inducible protein DinB
VTAPTLQATVASILARDLAALRRELEAYPDERDLWATPPGVPNSAGTLALHLAGNLRHYVGAVLGGDGYVRDRDAEFARRDVPRAELAAGIAEAEAAVRRTLAALPDARLAEEFPQPVGERRIVTADYLVHLAAHLAYHLGQVDYHRRLVTGDGRGVGAVSPRELASARA